MLHRGTRELQVQPKPPRTEVAPPINDVARARFAAKRSGQESLCFFDVDENDFSFFAIHRDSEVICFSSGDVAGERNAHVSPFVCDRGRTRLPRDIHALELGNDFAGIEFPHCFAFGGVRKRAGEGEHLVHFSALCCFNELGGLLFVLGFFFRPVEDFIAPGDCVSWVSEGDACVVIRTAAGRRSGDNGINAGAAIENDSRFLQ